MAEPLDELVPVVPPEDPLEELLEEPVLPPLEEAGFDELFDAPPQAVKASKAVDSSS